MSMAVYSSTSGQTGIDCLIKQLGLAFLYCLRGIAAVLLNHDMGWMQHNNGYEPTHRHPTMDTLNALQGNLGM